MAFNKKVWVDRVSEYPTRRKLAKVQEPDIYDVQRDEGNILEEGDAFAASTMNDLENRIESETGTLEGYFSDGKAKTSLNSEKLGGIAASGYLQIAGGTMTGDLKIKKGVRTDTPIKLYEGDVNGNGLVIQAGGRTIIGGGEAAGNLRDALTEGGEADTAEKLYLAADTDISLITNCNTISSRKTVTVSTAGKITAPGGFSGALNPSDLSAVVPVIKGGTGTTSLANITVGNASKLGGTAASGYQLKETASWKNLTLASGVTGDTTLFPQYCKIYGVVYIRGWVSKATITNRVFTLPAGFRPGRTEELVVSLSASSAVTYGVARITIQPNGETFLQACTNLSSFNERGCGVTCSFVAGN